MQSGGGGGGGSWGPEGGSTGGYIYPFGQAIWVSSPQDVYNALARYEELGVYSKEEMAQQFSNNPFGISYQELMAPPAQYQSYSGTATGGTAPSQVTVDLGSKIDALNNLYNLIYGDLSSQTQEKQKQLTEQYGKQRGDLQSQYEKNSAVLPNAFAAQGIRDSSYYERAATDAADTYNSNLSAIQQNQDQSLAGLGRQYQQALSGYQSAQSMLGQTPRSFTGTAAEAQAAQSTLDSRLNELSAARSGLMTDAGYRGALNSIAPVQNMGASQLQEQLAKITNSSIPGYAKDTIAQGLIKQSGQDPNFYTDYYEKIKGGASTPLQ